MPKRAKTIEHDALSSKALRWIASRATRRGIRGSTEVQLAPSYLADAACIGSCQDRFLRAYCAGSDLTPLCRTPRSDGQWDTMGDIDHTWLMVFEAKRTRTDFLATFSDTNSPRHTPIGSLHWLVTSRKLIRPDELWDWWGLLETYGSGLTEVRMPRLFPVAESRLHAVANELVWHHRYGERGRMMCEDVTTDDADLAHVP